MAGDFDELIQKMDLLRQDAFVAANRKALRAVGKIIKDAIVDRAPVLDKKTAQSTSLDPGALKGDIQVHVQLAKSVVDSNRVRVGPGSKTGYVANMVENGHANVKGGYSKAVGDGKRRGTGHIVESNPRTPAHPFIRPAADAVEQKAIDTYVEVMTGEIEKVMNG